MPWLGPQTPDSSVIVFMILPTKMLVALHEQARLEFYGEDRLHRQRAHGTNLHRPAALDDRASSRELHRLRQVTRLDDDEAEE